MGLRNAYLSMIRAMPGGWDSMAAALGMSKVALENRIYERKEQRLHVDTALAMQALSGAPRFAAAIAQESGGVFVPLPEIEMAGREELFDKQQELLAELGELFARFREFTADNELDARESVKLRHLVDEVHRGLQEFMAVALQLYARHHAGPGEHQ